MSADAVFKDLQDLLLQRLKDVKHLKLQRPDLQDPAPTAHQERKGVFITGKSVGPSQRLSGSVCSSAASTPLRRGTLVQEEKTNAGVMSDGGLPT